MKLTDNEKRDAIKYLEAGKPLPEKYRFLLFDDDREVELLWNGKSNEVTNVVLPFQTIEQIDEPRSNDKIGLQDSLFDTSGRQITGWTNKLIWGDNKLILSSLKNGPMRKEIEAQGGLKLIYIDPPFDVGADFSMDIKIGDGEDEESFTKKPSVIEEIAYRDTWGKGADSFIAMIYERLKLMYDLLAEDGSIYVHCDWRVNSYMRLVLDEVFGKDHFINEITWKRIHTVKGNIGQGSKYMGANTDTIFAYGKSQSYIFNNIFLPYSEDYISSFFKYTDIDTGRKYRLTSMIGPGGSAKGNPNYEVMGITRYWRYSEVKMNELIAKGLIVQTSPGTVPQKKQYLDEGLGVSVQSLWDDLVGIGASSGEGTSYPTQKPEALLERIIKASSNEGDLVADFFCGSGTTLAVAEKLGRKWIGTDLGKFGIHTTRKRMIGVQRELKKEGKNFRAFEILNLGRYERDNFVNVSGDLREEEKQKVQERKEQEFIKLILTAYKAESVTSYDTFVGKKRDRLVAIGPINTPVSSQFIDRIMEECVMNKVTKVDILGFDYEMGLDTSKAKKYGIDVQLKVIPREVFDKKAVEKGQVKFYDVAFIEVEAIKKGHGKTVEVTIKLNDFSVFYNQDDSGETEEALKPGSSKVIVENGQVVKLSKDKKTELISKEVLTKKWSDWIDYWAVDFDFASRKEIVKEMDKDGKEVEKWTGDYIFDNEWQSFRTKKNRNLELVSAPKDLPKGNYKVAVKVVDIFGNDTTKVIEVKI